MDTDPFGASQKLPIRTNAKLPKRSVGPLSGDQNTKLPNGAETATPIAPDKVLPNGTNAKMPSQRISAAERLRRLEEAMAFLRAHLASGPQPARRLLKAANTAGIAERTLHRAKDLLGVTTQRSGGYAGHGQWVWFPPAVLSCSQTVTAREAGAAASGRR